MQLTTIPEPFQPQRLGRKHDAPMFGNPWKSAVAGRGVLPAPILQRYLKFCIVGGTGVVVDTALLWLLTSPVGLGLYLALGKALAAEGAILNNFLWNDLWTFRRARDSGENCAARLRRLARFNAICIAGIGLSIVLLQLQVFLLHFNLYLANLIAIVLVSLWNFLLNERFGWRQERRATHSPPAQ